MYNDLEQELSEKKGLKDNKRQLTEDRNSGRPTLNPESSCSSSERRLNCDIIFCTSYLSHFKNQMPQRVI